MTRSEIKKSEDNCILCRSGRVDEFLNLGDTALANQFLRQDEIDVPEPKYPLRVGFCRSCGHVQLLDSVPPLEMFENYLYISSASDTLKNHLWDLSDELVRVIGSTRADLVMDIGCNDGTLLEGFKRHGVRTLGVDPARNLAEFSSGNGDRTLHRSVHCGDGSTKSSQVGTCPLVTATNTFPHIQDLRDFVQACETVLSPAACLSSRCTIFWIY